MVYQKGIHSWSWKGGIRKGGRLGYILIYYPEHPCCTKSGYVLEHRLVMEQYLKRFLTEDEVVHHINGIVTDNQLKNLRLMKKEEHHSLHVRGKNNPNWKDGISKNTEEYHKKWYQKNKEKVKEYQQKNKEKINKRKKEIYWEKKIRRLIEEKDNPPT